MKYSVAPEVFSAYPGYVRGVVVARNCVNGESNPRLVELLRGAESAARLNPLLDNLASHPRIAAWRMAYSAFGATPSKFPSSVEAILKRAHRGDSLPYINDLVALGTYITLKYLLPTGGHDLDRTEGDLLLTFATGDEVFRPLGSDALEHPERGEVIYRDDAKVLCRRWTWRQADADKVTLATRNVEMNVDGLPPTSMSDVRAAMAECAALLRQLCGAETRELMLSATSPCLEL